jgi:RNA polymerase sigma-70 factor (ECF subfamily)
MQSVCALSGWAPALARGPHQATSDESLIQSIARSDKRAMHVLFARHNVRVYRFVLRLVGDTALAEDLVSEVFLEVWRKAARFEGRSQVSTWLLAIARYKAISQLRNRSVDQLDEQMAETIPDPADNSEEIIEKRDRGAVLRKCLKELSPAHREIIDLFYYHEQSMEEVARILQVPQGTVRTRMFYARKQLAELLRAHSIDRDDR